MVPKWLLNWLKLDPCGHISGTTLQIGREQVRIIFEGVGNKP